MAGTSSAAVLSLRSPCTPPRFISSLLSHKPSKPFKRKNYLRPKILKTLNPKPSSTPINPIITSPTETLPLIPIPPRHETREVESLPQAKSIELEEFRVSESVSNEGNFIISGKSLFKYGAWLVGLFLFQTVCSVWVLGRGNGNADLGSEVSKSSGFGFDEREKRKGLLINGRSRGVLGNSISGTSNVVYMDESDLNRRIEEIRLMAREARMKEKKEKEKKEKEADDAVDEDDEEDGLVSKSKIAIEKEIGSRLSKLQERMNNGFTPKSMNDAIKSTRSLGKNGTINGASDTEGMDDKLVFKKKSKFKSMSMEDSRPAPKGFNGLKGKGGASRKKGGSSLVNERGSNSSELLKQENENLRDSRNEKAGDTIDGGIIAREDTGSPVYPKEIKVGENKKKSGVVQMASQARPSHEVVKSRSLDDQGSKNFQSLRKEKREVPKKSDSYSSTSKLKEARTLSSVKKDKDKQSDNDTNPWWLNLPYIFAILMRRSSDSGQPEGLFSLKFPSDEMQHGQSSFVVGFEDRVDANNFCYILESYFEDLGDFIADIVPLMKNELQEVVKGKTMKLVVLRKGQLQLYAGQPFTEVEMALQSLVTEDQTSYK